MSAILKEQGLDKIDKAARSRLLKVMQHRDEIEAWLAGLPVPKRLKLNHPQTVLSAWTRVTTPATPKSKPKPDLKAAWDNASLEERRAFFDDSRLRDVLDALSPTLRKNLERRLTNPHADRRLDKIDAAEKLAIAEAEKGVAHRRVAH
jgi:hypothetical protein